MLEDRDDNIAGFYSGLLGADHARWFKTVDADRAFRRERWAHNGGRGRRVVIRRPI